MYKRILIATDGSELANKALNHGLALAKLDKAPVSVVTVTNNWTPFEMAHDYSRGTTNPVGSYEAQATEAAKAVLDKAGEAAKSQGVDCTLIHVADKASCGRYRGDRHGSRRRPDRHGVAWTPGRQPPAPGKPGE